MEQIGYAIAANTKKNYFNENVTSKLVKSWWKGISSLTCLQD